MDYDIVITPWAVFFLIMQVQLVIVISFIAHWSAAEKQLRALDSHLDTQRSKAEEKKNKFSS